MVKTECKLILISDWPEFSSSTMNSWLSLKNRCHGIPSIFTSKFLHTPFIKFLMWLFYTSTDKFNVTALYIKVYVSYVIEQS